MVPNLSALGQGPRKRCLFISFAVVAFSAINFLHSQRLTGSADGRIEGILFNPPPGDVGTANSTIIARDEIIMDGAQHVNTTPSSTTLSPSTSNTTASTPLPLLATPPPPLQGTVVLQLLGELGNHLSAFAFYYAVRTIALTEFNLNLTLHVRKQRHSKAESAAMNAKCLASFRDLDFDECNWSLNKNNGTNGELCAGRVNNQMSAFQDLERYGLGLGLGNPNPNHDNHTIADLARSLHLRASTSDDIRLFLRSYAAMLTDPSILQLYRVRDVGWTADERYPFLFNIDRLHASDTLINEFYSKGLPEYLAFDEETKMSSGCCSVLPEKDEQVFHYRSFIVDLPRGYHMSWGGAELTPDRAANMLSAAVSPGTKIALVAGRSSRDRAMAYVTALSNQSFDVRQVVGQTSIQDFCFLAHAQAGLWGTIQSTYIGWASLISKDLQNATLYGVNYPARTKNITGKVATNADLARIIHYPVFDLSDDDVW